MHAVLFNVRASSSTDNLHGDVTLPLGCRPASVRTMLCSGLCGSGQEGVCCLWGTVPWEQGRVSSLVSEGESGVRRVRHRAAVGLLGFQSVLS